MSDLEKSLKEVHDYLEKKHQGAYKNTVIDAIIKIKELEQKLVDAEKLIKTQHVSIDRHVTRIADLLKKIEMLEYEKTVICSVAFPNLKFVKDGKPIIPPQEGK